MSLLGADRLYTVYLVLPDGYAGIISPPSGMTLLLEEELTEDEPSPTGILAHSPVHKILREWAQIQKSAVNAIVLDPTESGPPGTSSYKLPAIVTGWHMHLNFIVDHTYPLQTQILRIILS
jgi:hypothetical protein